MLKIIWSEWSRTAFQRAKNENKPIILDIFGSWCHWCHRMDKDTYESEDIIKIINDKFVAIRVDTDKRPDINERYNQGGWPTTAFLTPDGELIMGATYVPAQQMINLLAEVDDFYRHNKIAETSKENFYEENTMTASSPKDITDNVISDVLDDIIAHFDVDFGGFGGQPKFPLPDAVEFLIRRYKKTGDNKLLSMITKTLDGMLGLLDKEEGGFFRYSVTREWSQPHYEKMLETNSKLLRVYALGFALTNNEDYMHAASQTADYLLNVLSNTKNYFYGSQDADGEEEYYGKTKNERQTIKMPSIDRIAYTSWNGLAAGAFLDAGRIFENLKYKEFALGVIDFFVQRGYVHNAGFGHYLENYEPNILGFLYDNASMMWVLSKAYLATNNKFYLTNAEWLATFLMKNMKSENGGFFDKTKNGEDIGLLVVQQKPLVENSLAAIALLNLYKITGNESYLHIAKEVLQDFVLSYKKLGVHAAQYAIAVERYLKLSKEKNTGQLK